jgi:isopenicillin-N epimerase
MRDEFGVLPGILPAVTWLLDEYRIEVPIVPWPRPPARLVRVSGQVYNSADDYQRLVAALPALL